MEKLNLDKKTLRKFGITMGSIFLIIALIILIRHKHSVMPTLTASALFLILAFTLPALLKPVYILWMRIAFVLGWINTRLILSILFYLLFTPIGLIMRLFRADPLDRQIAKEKDSYWRKKEKVKFNPINYERQF